MNPLFVEGAPLYSTAYLESDRDNQLTWTKDIEAALRFPNKKLAEQYAEKLIAEAPEHGFLTVGLFGDESPEEDEIPVSKLYKRGASQCEPAQKRDWAREAYG